MDISLISDITTQSLGLSNLPHRQNLGSHTIAISESPSAAVIHISAAIFDAIAPPPVKPSKYKTMRRTLLRRKRRTRRKSYCGGESEEYGCFGGGDGGDDGGFGGGNWGGGRGWNFGGFGGQNWNEESSSSFSAGFAYGFVYEVIYWIALSNCVHFAFKKFVRFFTEREKVPLRLASVC